MERGTVNPEEEGAFAAGATLAGNGDVIMYWERNDATGPSTVSAHVQLATSPDGFNFSDQGKIFDHRDAPWRCGGDEIGPLGSYTYQGTWYVFLVAESGCWDLGVAWGPARDQLTSTTGLLTSGADVIGGADPIFIAPDTIALFIVRDFTERIIEVRTAPADAPQQLSDPVAVYDFPDLKHATVFLDRESETWFMYYQSTDSDRRYKVRTAPMVGGD